MVEPGAKVLVAMSGGVDSSVAAALLLRAGFDVVGVFMRLGTPDEPEGWAEATPAAACAAGEGETTAREGGRTGAATPARGCCSVGDAADARLVAAELGVPLYVCNFRKDFGRVIDYFVGEYARGRTPNPCVRCNDWLKFGKLHDYAERIGAQAVASGHYARIARRDGAPALLRGRDSAKDQSYVLFGAGRERLGSMLLPIGEFESKAAVRAEASRLGLPVFDKPDSQEICFVPDDDYAGLVERRRPDLAGTRGAVVDLEGRVVGEHEGQHRYTIGQRRGVGVALGFPIYVVGKNANSNTITVGPKDALRTRALRAEGCTWLVEPGCVGQGREVLAQTRYGGGVAPARASVGPGDALALEFDEPQSAIAPGQAVVLYDLAEPDRVLGGGWIADAIQDQAR